MVGLIFHSHIKGKNLQGRKHTGTWVWGKEGNC